MAKLPKYQRAGVQAAEPPRIDFAAARESARLGATMSQTFERMADFLHREQIRKDEQRAGEIVSEMGAQPVLAKLREAGGPTTAGERKAYEIANRIASSEIETEALLAINKTISDGEIQETPYVQISENLKDIVDGFPAALADLNPEVAGILRARLASHASNAELRYSSFWNKKQKEDAQGKALLGFSARQDNIYKLAASEADPDFRTTAVDMFIASLAQDMRDRDIDEDVISRTIISTKQQAVIEGLLGDFQRTGNVKEKIAFLEELVKDPPIELGLEKTRTLVRTLNAEVNNSRSISKALARDIVKDIGDAKKILEGSGDPGTTVMNSLAVRIQDIPEENAAEAIKKYSELQVLRDRMIALRKMDPVTLQNEINKMRAGLDDIGEEGIDTVTEVEVIKSAETLLANMNTALEKDPLSWSMRSLNLDFKPLDLPSMSNPGTVTPDQAYASARYRKKLAYTAQYVHKGPLRFLTNEEAAQISVALREGNRVQQLAILGDIVQYFGSDAKEVIAQISKKSPEMGHIGGLIVMEEFEAANEALQGLEQIKNGSKAIGIEGDIPRSIFIGFAGQSLQYQPSSRANGLKIAKAIYTYRANNEGLTEFNEEIWEQSIQRAFGYDENTRKGGFQEIRDRIVLLPTKLNQDDMETMLESITLEQLQENTGLIAIDADIIGDINNNPRVYPVLMDEGRYALMFDVSGSPRHFTDKQGNPIVVDALKYYKHRNTEQFETVDVEDLSVNPVIEVENLSSKRKRKQQRFFSYGTENQRDLNKRGAAR